MNDMYWNAIIWFLSWPAFIVIAWFLVRFTINKYNDSFETISG